MKKGTLTIISVLLGLSFLLQLFPIAANKGKVDTEYAAKKVEKYLEIRASILNEALTNPIFERAGLPEDMVVYRYAGDTLQLWKNQFTIADDGIRPHVDVPRLTNPRMVPRSPLSDLTDSVSFCNFGPKWFLIKITTEGNVKTICGIEVINTLEQGKSNGVNRHLHLSNAYSIRPLSYDEGTPVYLEGKPVFKVAYETLDGSRTAASASFVWLSVFLFVIAVLMIVKNKKGSIPLVFSLAGILLCSFTLWLWGKSAGSEFRLFSPEVYSDGQLLYSLGSIFIINSALTLMAVCIYLNRGQIRRTPFSLASVSFASASILFYSWYSLRSLVINSNISLELFKFYNLSLFSAGVYVSFLALLSCIPVLFGTVLKERKHLRLLMVLYSAGISLALLVLASTLGIEKESARLEIWANRLSIDRDIDLELQLRRNEEQIAKDPFIASLLLIANAEASIENRLSDNYFSRLSQSYDIRVLNGVPELPVSEPLAPESHFYYAGSLSGRPRYLGVFFYNVGNTRVHLAFTIVQREDARSRGYASIAGLTSPGLFVIPPFYSYARYEGRNVINFKGNYAYPIIMGDRLFAQVYGGDYSYLVYDGYYHFFYKVTDDESVIISRPSTDFFTYMTSFLLLAMAMYLILSLVLVRNKPDTGRAYFRKRISIVVQASLILTLVVMALVSVLFVFNRNESNLRSLMSDKINSTREMIQSRISGVGSIEDLRSHEFVSLLESVAANSNSDVTIYSPSGKLFMSTSFLVFETGVMGSRMNDVAYNEVVLKGHRYFINKEKIGRRAYYNMYAPLFDDEGKVLSIIASPYTEESSDFERDAITHSVAIITLFLILFLFARITVSSVIDKMFKPISEIGDKMGRTGLNSLEQIQYERDDEVRSLVLAYNRMVTELSDSTKRLAQAERDKAWSGMARQVAHEIKNPLTPMKLQLQRIMRLKDKNDPSWQEKFDEMSKVILEHIDILTDTANEFSTFAKLYTEEPTEIDLDKLLRNEISMYDSRSDIDFDYMGLPGVTVYGPKPQLTRVFVNLINNAVQAVEHSDDVTVNRANPAKVMVSLRKSSEDGYYDIVVEDNGDGVSPDNIDKLFTPNFTTKNGGSGLGLAISRSILERCGATISYSKSFVLGGACFIVRYPAN